MPAFKATAFGHVMRIITLLLLLILSFCSNGQTKNPFLYLKFDKVIIYDYEPYGENPSLVDNGQILKAVKIKKQIQLDKAAIDRLNAKLGDRKSYGSNHAACFEPHLGIVYYLQYKIVANVIICLDCNLLSSSIDIPALKQGKHALGKDTYYTLDGLSKPFRQFLNDLLKKYNFSHQIQASSMFDK
jgi:hypothetical protein